MVSFANPPINELVLDVQFQPIPNFGTSDVAGVRELFVKDFPTYQEQLPLAEELERYDNRGVFTFGVGQQIPPIRRQWFLNENGTRLLQFQPNRLIHNWRRPDDKLMEKNDYPSFDSVLPNFVEYLRKLNEYCAEKYSGSLKMIHWEVTKFNFIPLDVDWKTDLNRIFTFCFDIDYGDNIQTEAVSYNKKAILNGEDGKPTGRLYVSLDVTDYAPQQKAAIVRFSARGHAENFSVDYCIEKMKASNELINQAFVASTKDDVRKARWSQK